jgi:hypothetical protein
MSNAIKIGPEILVNSTPDENQIEPAITALSDPQNSRFRAASR